MRRSAHALREALLPRDPAAGGAAAASRRSASGWRWASCRRRPRCASARSRRCRASSPRCLALALAGPWIGAASSRRFTARDAGGGAGARSHLVTPARGRAVGGRRACARWRWWRAARPARAARLIFGRGAGGAGGCRSLTALAVGADGGRCRAELVARAALRPRRPPSAARRAAGGGGRPVGLARRALRALRGEPLLLALASWRRRPALPVERARRFGSPCRAEPRGRLIGVPRLARLHRGAAAELAAHRLVGDSRAGHAAMGWLERDGRSPSRRTGARRAARERRAGALGSAAAAARGRLTPGGAALQAARRWREAPPACEAGASEPASEVYGRMRAAVCGSLLLARAWPLRRHAGGDALVPARRRTTPSPARGPDGGDAAHRWRHAAITTCTRRSRASSAHRRACGNRPSAPRRPATEPLNFDASELDFYPVVALRALRRRRRARRSAAAPTSLVVLPRRRGALGLQYPMRVTPFLEVRLVAGMMGGSVAGTSGGQLDLHGRLDTGIELYVSGRLYLSVAIGWAHPVYAGSTSRRIPQTPHDRAQGLRTPTPSPSRSASACEPGRVAALGEAARRGARAAAMWPYAPIADRRRRRWRAVRWRW